MALLIPAANPGPLTGAGNNTWLFDGTEPALIDAGIGAPDHVEAIRVALGGRPLAHVYVTHGHPDHAAGVPALRAQWPALRAHKWLDEHTPTSGWHALHDAAPVVAGDATLDVLHTPGHAADHVCFWHAPTRALFAGDLLIQGTTVMIPAGRGGNLREYLASLERMAALEPRRVYPGHGPVIDDPVALIAEYLEHRRLRERQVLACLEAGITDVDEMVSRIYAGVPTGVLPAARLTLEAHLEKIRDEGTR